MSESIKNPTCEISVFRCQPGTICSNCNRLQLSVKMKNESGWLNRKLERRTDRSTGLKFHSLKVVSSSLLVLEVRKTSPTS